ncbi:uncharacterized protein LOC143899347 isoform X3 [Temnothorax americanus]|uniref:uncharacterized protein LOC143899347 isoform X3 n=1 Tax=Temnothorax americanus TaxID=1964332 RepID=UPI004069250A
MKQICQSNICLPVRTHYCLKSFSACNRTNISSISGFCMNSICINIVKGNASHAFYQYFEVEYNWIDLNDTKVFIRSGNPGYVMELMDFLHCLWLKKMENVTELIDISSYSVKILD